MGEEKKKGIGNQLVPTVPALAVLSCVTSRLPSSASSAGYETNVANVFLRKMGVALQWS